MFESFVNERIDIEKSEISKLTDTLPEGTFVTRVQILNCNLTDFTKNYLLYDFNEEYSSDELDAQISKANKLQFNYTIRPKWTLQTFLFNNFESRPPNDIIKKLNLFTFYNFYTESVKDFITDNFQIFMTKGEATAIIDRTNKAIYEKLTSEISNVKIKNFFLQIFLLKYEEESKYNLESSIPYSFVKIFLEDKSFIDLLSKFDSLKDLKDETEISLKDIIKILTGKYGDSEDQETNVKTDSPEPGVTTNQLSKDETLTETPAKQVLIINDPIDKKTADELPKRSEKTDISKKNKEPKISEENKDNVMKTHSDKNLKKEVIYSKELIKAGKGVEPKSLIEKNSEEKENAIKELKDLFNERQLDKILNKVYGSDLIYQEKSFNKLDHFKTWFEASNHLKEIFYLNGVDLYNKDVVTFVNILNDHYKSKE